MPVQRTRRIIAVFGGSEAGSDALKMAEALGHEITYRKQILLTGGRKAASTPVKHRAIHGAGANAWIGVDRKQVAPATIGYPMESGVVITSDLDEKRNYLEAAMSDAAIAVEGGDGTKSEVASALSQQRPVAFVGPTWEDFCATLTAQPESALDTLIDAANLVFGRSAGPNTTLDDRVAESALRQGLADGLCWKCFGAAAGAKEIVAWIMDAVPADRPFPGALPPGVHEQLVGDYETWLREHAS